MIAQITKDEILASSIKEVWKAITRLRVEHQLAGWKLHGQLIAAIAQTGEKISENGSRMEIPGVGAVWIVRVEFVAEQSEQRGRNEVNRLLWDHQTG
jgi:hypothetical protein